MPDYRRSWVPGGTYFFTVALFERKKDLLVAEIERLFAKGLPRQERLSAGVARSAVSGIDGIGNTRSATSAIWRTM